MVVDLFQVGRQGELLEVDQLLVVDLLVGLLVEHLDQHRAVR
jgi:hypothetical protein